MKTSKLKTTLTILLLTLLGTFSLQAQTTEKDVTIIELTQTDGKFYTEKLNLVSGKYQFKIVNKDVKKDLGFVIQKASDKNGDVMKTAVKDSFTTALVKTGETQYSGVVTLTKGEYVYSCPLNPTPHYTISVK